MTFFTSIVVFLTNLYIVILLFKLNSIRLSNWKPNLIFFLILITLLAFNRGVFIYDYIFSETPSYYNATTPAEQNYLIHLILFIIPSSVYAYLYNLIGNSIRISFLKGGLFLLIPIFSAVFNLDQVEIFYDIDWELMLLIIFSSFFSIDLILFVFRNKELSTLATVWVLTIIYAFANILAKILYTSALESQETRKFSDGQHMLTANLIIFFIHIVIIFRFRRILTGDINVELSQFRELAKHQENENLSFYKNFKIWNNHGPAGDVKVNGIKNEHISFLENNKAQILKNIRDAERDFIESRIPFEVFENMYNLSQHLGLNMIVLGAYFKPYCLYSFSDYNKVLRVLKGEFLIRSCYLDKHGVDELSQSCSFNNRVTMYNNFKKYIGYSLREYKNLLGV